METNSLASGQGGNALGTESLPALPFFTPPTEPARAPGAATGTLFAQEFERAVERTRGSGPAAERLEKLEGERRSARRASFGRERPATEDAHAEEAVYRSGQGPQVAAPAVHEPTSDDAASASATPPSFEEASASGGGASSITAAESTPTLAAPANAAVPSVASLASSVRVAAEAVAPASPAGAAPPPLATPPVERAEAPRAPPTTGATSAPERAGTAVLERAEEVLRQIQLHLTPGVKRLTLELQPAELGRMAIQLALRGGKLTAIVRGERAETLAALEQHEPELRAVLARRGIAVDSVRFELGFDRSRSNASARTTAAATARAPVPPPLTPPASTPRRDGALDLYA